LNLENIFKNRTYTIGAASVAGLLVVSAICMVRKNQNKKSLAIQKEQQYIVDAEMGTRGNNNDVFNTKSITGIVPIVPIAVANNNNPADNNYIYSANV